jgi:F0F1-type ATP synthase assembly protein I
MEAVFAVPIAAGIGWWIDSRLGTAPVLLLIGLGVGFATFIVRLASTRRLMEEAAAEAQRERERRE